MFKSSGSLDEAANFVWISSAFFVCKWDHWNPSNLLIDLDKSSLFHNTSARYEQHECNTNDTVATRVLHERHEWDTSVTQAKNFDFDNDASESMLSHYYISYITNEKLQGEEQFHSKNYLLNYHASFPCQMRFKSASQKLKFLIAKAISKSYTLDCRCKCPYTFPHSNTVSFSMKTTSCETNNILARTSKN